MSAGQDAVAVPRTAPRPAIVLALTSAAAVLVLVLALLVGGGAPRPGPVGLPDAGAGTGWAVPVLRLLQHVAAVTTVGALLAGLLATDGGRRTPGGAAVIPTAAAAWAASAVASVVVGLSEAAGRPLRTVLDLELVQAYTGQVATGRALLLTAALAFAVALAAPLAALVPGRVALLVLALAALVPPLRTGHAATAADHDLAVVATSVHVVAVVLWVGGLGALVAQRQGPSLAVAVPRFSALALPCFVAVAVSGSLSAWTRLAAMSDLWTTAYGALLLAKTAALLALGGAGWLHRRHTVAVVARGEQSAFTRLAVAELGLMAIALGLAVALTRTA